MLDQAYFEYVDDPDYPDGIETTSRRAAASPSCARSRRSTGSPGCASATASRRTELVVALGKARPRLRPDARPRRWPRSRASATRPSSSAGARANARAPAELERILRGHGFEPVGPAVANFLFVDVGGDARAVFERLLREGVIVRPLGGFGAPGAIRVTVGTREEHAFLDEALARVAAPASTLTPLEFRDVTRTTGRGTRWSRACGAGDRRALARAITLVEDARPARATSVVRELYPDTGHAYAVGVTGPPGVGKSSLISALVRHVRAAGPDASA